MQKKKQAKRNHSKNQLNREKPAPKALPFIEHLFELRRRLFYVAVSVGVWSGLAYAVQMHIVSVLLRPAHGQSFIYTSPGGGLDFLFRICIYTGLILSTPVIVYNILRYIEPLITRASLRFIAWGSFAATLLAAAGVLFGYYIGLPAALHFLLHQFTTLQIKPLVTIQSYMSFVMVYMLGSALLFQVPLMIIFINRVKPLTPRGLFRYERWVILFAFILAGLMNPTPNLIDQMLLVGPIIFTYQFGILLIYFINRPARSKKVQRLLAEDSAMRAARLERVQSAKALWQAAETIADQPTPLRPTVQRRTQRIAQASITPPKVVTVPAPPQKPQPESVTAIARPGRPQKYLDGFSVPRRSY
jgi:sec-independent protein translocase protein TatC